MAPLRALLDEKIRRDHGVALPTSQKASSGTPTKAGRPNYSKIHARPLPVEVHPLPAFIPHNPLSLLRIAYAFFSEYFNPPKRHPTTPYKGYFSPETRSVHVTDPDAVRALWEMGFFGKGSLSRSEPTWLDREKKRLGLLAVETSEEMTRRRREGRRTLKMERARKEREVIEEQLRQEGKLEADGMHPSPSDQDGSNLVVENSTSDEINNIGEHRMNGTSEEHLDRPHKYSSANGDLDESQVEILEARNFPHRPESQPVITGETLEDDIIKDEEHLQLTLEEAFFLVYGLGVLEVLDPGMERAICNATLFREFRKCSQIIPGKSQVLDPEDPFLINYVVYHHFRSLGWVVRLGVKFAVDYLLYNRGPPFAHAEFAVVIIPAYTDSYWLATPERALKVQEEQKRSWRWLHCVNRVQAQVMKTLIFVYVDIPPPIDEEDESLNITKTLRCYRVHEFILRRWIPNRNRD